MGRKASGIEMPFKDDGYYAVKDIPHGDPRIKRYNSSLSNTWRRFINYTPPGYKVNTNEKYPVIYFLHGGYDNERGCATQGKTDLILDNLTAWAKDLYRNNMIW